MENNFSTNYMNFYRKYEKSNFVFMCPVKWQQTNSIIWKIFYSFILKSLSENDLKWFFFLYNFHRKIRKIVNNKRGYAHLSLAGHSRTSSGTIREGPTKKETHRKSNSWGGERNEEDSFGISAVVDVLLRRCPSQWRPLNETITFREAQPIHYSISSWIIL